MNRQSCIDLLVERAPVVLEVTISFDMGYEFSALPSKGIISGEPGMLLDYSGGEWPLEEVSAESYQRKLMNMLEHFTSYVTAWDDIPDVELEEIIDRVTELSQ